MEQVVGPLDDARLAESEEGKRELARIGKLTNVRNRLVNPGILFVGKVNVGKSVLHKSRVTFARVSCQQPVHLFGDQSDLTVFDQRQPNVMVEAEQVIVRDLLTGLL